jgi:hypothetical protein
MKVNDIFKENKDHEESYIACIVDFDRSGQAIVRRSKPVSKEHAEQFIASAKEKIGFTHPPYMTVYPASAGKLDGETIMSKFPDLSKDIAEDGQPFGKIAAVTPDKVTIEKPTGSKIDIEKSAVLPDPTHPGQVNIDPTAAGDQLKPGDQATTQESLDETLTPQQQQALAPFLKKDATGQWYELPATDSKEKGATMTPTVTTPAALAQIKSPQGQQQIIQKLLAMTNPANAIKPVTATNQADAVTPFEDHHDTVASGNHDIGGDATDNFINQVRDKDFERKNRYGQGERSPISGKLHEGDELYHWLTIAGIK